MFVFHKDIVKTEVVRSFYKCFCYYFALRYAKNAIILHHK